MPLARARHDRVQRLRAVESAARSGCSHRCQAEIRDLRARSSLGLVVVRNDSGPFKIRARRRAVRRRVERSAVRRREPRMQADKPTAAAILSSERHCQGMPSNPSALLGDYCSSGGGLWESRRTQCGGDRRREPGTPPPLGSSRPTSSAGLASGMRPLRTPG